MTAVVSQGALSHDYVLRDRVQEQSPAQVTDERLIRLVARGEASALETLYHRHSARLFNYLLRLIHEPTVAEDLLQEVFVAVWQGAGRFRGRSKVRTWLYRITHNKAVSWLRREQQTVGLENAYELSSRSDPQQEAMAHWRGEQIHTALDGLSDKHRSVLELAFYHGLKYQEIAEIIGCPVGTVKSRVSYARNYFGQALESLGVTEPGAGDS